MVRITYVCFALMACAAIGAPQKNEMATLVLAEENTRCPGPVTAPTPPGRVRTVQQLGTYAQDLERALAKSEANRRDCAAKLYKSIDVMRKAVSSG